MLVNICEAKATLSALLKRAQGGEEIVIARAGKPVAYLVPILPARPTRNDVRFGGLKMAKLRLSSDFHELMSDDDLI